MASERFLEAPMRMARFSRTWSWPMTSASILGRMALSVRSSGCGSGEMSRSSSSSIGIDYTRIRWGALSNLVEDLDVMGMAIHGTTEDAEMEESFEIPIERQ